MIFQRGFSTVFYTEEAQPAVNEDLVSEFSFKLCNRGKVCSILNFLFLFLILKPDPN